MFKRTGSLILLAAFALCVSLYGCKEDEETAICDADHDGFLNQACGGGDCDDNDIAIHPGAIEICGNQKDDDCNSATPDLFDADGDGDNCAVDCNDSNPKLGPSQKEICNNKVDDDCNPATLDLFDADGDGDNCLVDCDDNDPEVGPSHAEICGDTKDNDCSKRTPDVVDADHDSYDCTADCDDRDPNVNPGPGQIEICGNDKDDECDGNADCRDEDCMLLAECGICGNGEKGYLEECDDGDNLSGDGCSENCKIETGWSCDTSADPSVCATVCGDNLLAGDESCDDGNECIIDGCNACELEQSMVLTSLILDANVGFDLDNLDGDNNLYTGVDNKLAQDDLIKTQLNSDVDQSIRNGWIIQLLTFGNIDSLNEDAEISVSVFGGVNPACPTVYPVPWMESDNAPVDIYSDLNTFSNCVPQVWISDIGNDDPFIGILKEKTNPAQPTPPILQINTALFQLSIGGVPLEIKNAHLDATITNNGTVFTGLENGVIAGKITAKTLYDMETDLPFCPTALHFVLGRVGQPDQDTEGNLTLDTFNFTIEEDTGDMPCINARVIIKSCLDDATNTVIPGEDCARSESIQDGYSSGFTLSAIQVHVIGQVSSTEYCY